MSEVEAKRIVIALGRDANPAVGDALRGLKGVEVVDNFAVGSRLLVRDAFVPVDVCVIGASKLNELLANVGDEHRLFVVEAVLDDATAARLEDAGIAYVDGARRAWFPGLGRTTRARRTPAGGPYLRAARLRAAQLLADHPDRSWSERALAERAQTTGVTAHRLFAELAEADLIETRGRGRSSERWVSNIAGLRRWLASRARPSAATRTLSCFVRDPDHLPATLHDGRRLVLSGAHAAVLHGMPVLTNLSYPLYRVDADADSFEEIPAELGGFRTDAGPNLLLVADPGRLALTDARPVSSGALIAPPSRAMLDLYLEPRAAAAVDVFLDLWQEKVV